MFDAYCPACATRRLVFPTQIRAIEHGQDHTVVAFECWCGATASWSTPTPADRRAAHRSARVAS